MSRRVLRYEIPINDQPHKIPAGKILQLHPYRMRAITGERNRVEVWIETTVPDNWPHAEPIGSRQVQIFGTGQPLPEDATHLASTVDDRLVWHLYQLGDPA